MVINIVKNMEIQLNYINMIKFIIKIKPNRPNQANQPNWIHAIFQLRDHTHWKS